MGKGYLSYTMALILQALDNGYRYGFDVIGRHAGSPGGTVYPALRRLEDVGASSPPSWERPGVAQQPSRVRRRESTYELTREGRAAWSGAAPSDSGLLERDSNRAARATRRPTLRAGPRP